MNLDNLFCIDLDQPTLEGFRKFISAWLYRGNGFTLLVDPGPLSTIPHLRGELRRHGVERIDYVLLTHIHIDHAGGTGALLREFPEARVICHPEGIRHLVAPEKLWQGSRKVLGTLAEAYGEIVPVPQEKIGFEEEIGASGVRVFLTPGHAQHHCCYCWTICSLPARWPACAARCRRGYTCVRPLRRVSCWRSPSIPSTG